MTNIKSKQTLILSSDKHIFDFLKDFNNFGLLLPEKVVNWQCTPDNCSFKIQGLADIALEVNFRKEFSSIIYKSLKPSPFEFFLTTNIVKIDDNSSNVEIGIDAELNFMLETILKTPLTNFVNILVEKLKEYCESQKDYHI